MKPEKNWYVFSNVEFDSTRGESREIKYFCSPEFINMELHKKCERQQNMIYELNNDNMRLKKNISALNIEINFDSLQGEGFGGFIADSVKEGKAKIIIDLNAVLNCISDNPVMRFKKFFSEIVLHEILHGIEELFDKSFDENAVEQAVLKSRGRV